MEPQRRQIQKVKDTNEGQKFIYYNKDPKIIPVHENFCRKLKNQNWSLHVGIKKLKKEKVCFIKRRKKPNDSSKLVHLSPGVKNFFL